MTTHETYNRWLATQALAKRLGLCIATNNPGAGTKYRVYHGEGKDYWDPHPIFATNGREGDRDRVALFVEGYSEGYNRRSDEIQGALT